MTTPSMNEPSAVAQPDALLGELFQALADKSPKLAEATLLAAIPFHFDRELLRRLRASNDGLEEKIIDRLQRLSFLSETEEQYFITREVRRYLLNEGQKDPAHFRTSHERALAYFDEKLYLESAATPAQSEAWEQARLYHLLVVDPAQGVAYLQQLLRRARDEYRSAAAQRFLSIAEEQRPLLADPYSFYLDYLHCSIAQFQGRSTVCREQLTQLLTEHPNLPLDLQALIQRELGYLLAEESREVEALALTQQALVSFVQQDKPLESALTMLSLGRIHLQLALEVWGGGHPFHVNPPRFTQLWELLGFITRLPLVVYLISQLGFLTLLPVLHRVGSHMDWLVARLLVTAAKQFQHAQTLFAELDDRAGLIQTQEELGRLFIALNHPHQGEKIWRRLLDSFGATLDPYRRAVAELGLGWVLVRQNKLATAQSLLEKVLPIFTNYHHLRRMAQTETLLAQWAVRAGQPTLAVGYYQAALRHWQQDGNLQEATDIAHQLDELSEQPKLPMIDRQRANAASCFTTKRLYLTRYHHPLLDRFMRGALLVLVVVCFVTLTTAIQTETGTEVGATAQLIKPLKAAPDDEASPTVELTFSEQLKPDFKVSVAVTAVFWVLFSYLLLYTLIGLIFIWRTDPKTIHATAQANLYIDEEGIQLGQEGVDPLRFDWRAINAALLQDRFRMGQVTSIFSQTTLVSDERQLVIDGFTNRYLAVQALILRHLPLATPIYNLGFKVPASVSACFFLVSLLLLVLFVLLAQFPSSKALLITPYVNGYALSDFYNTSYLGIALPLLWWFLLQPMRRRLIFNPDSPVIWVVAGCGTCSALLAFFLPTWGMHSLGRPTLLPAVTAALLLMVTALHIFGARRLTSGQPPVVTPFFRSPGAYVYPTYLRYGLLLLVLIVLFFLTRQVGRELHSFHYLVQGNYYLQQGEKLRAATPAPLLPPLAAKAASKVADPASVAYQQALSNYDLSLQLQADSTVHNSRGAILDQLAQPEVARQAYQAAIALAPEEPTYQINLALSYSMEAAEVVTFAQKVALYEQALALYTDLLTQPAYNAQSVSPLLGIALQNQQDEAKSRLFRASSYYALARALSGKQQPEKTLDYAELAFQEYDWLIHHSPFVDAKMQATYYSGRGWSRLLLRDRYKRYQSVFDNNLYRATMLDAIADFAEAAHRDPNNVSAYTGLGWANWWYMLGVDGCQDAAKQKIDQTQYMQFRRDALTALSKAIRLQPTSGLHYRTHAQLYYLLRDCPGYDRLTVYQSIVADYNQALRYAPTNGGWHYRRGELYSEIAKMVTAPTAKLAAYQQAVESYKQSVLLEPSNHLRIAGLINAEIQTGMSEKAAVDVVLSLLSRPANDFTTYLQTSQEIVDYIKRTNRPAVTPWALGTLHQALALEPQSYAANWLLANTLYSSGDYTATLSIITQTIGVAPDPYALTLLRTQTYFRLHQYTQTIQSAEDGLQLKATADYSLTLWLANAYWMLGKSPDQPTIESQVWITATQFASQALNLATTPGQCQQVNTLFRNLHQGALANVAAEKALALGQDVKALKTLTDWFLAIPDFPHALAAANAGDQLDPTFESLRKLGWNANVSGFYTVAVTATLQALALNPHEPLAYFNLGLIHLSAGNLPAAEAAYNQAIAVADEPGNVLIRQPRYNEAITDLRAIKQDPQNAYLRYVEKLRLARNALARTGP